MPPNPYQSPEERGSAAPREDWLFLRIFFGLTLMALGLPFSLVCVAGCIVILLGEKVRPGSLPAGLVCMAIGAGSAWYGLRLMMRRQHPGRK